MMDSSFPAPSSFANLRSAIAVGDSLRDPTIFERQYLGAELPPHQKRWLRLGLNAKRALILAPVGHGKSWTMAFVLPLLAICRNRNVRIILCSKTAGLACLNLRRIAGELATNEALKESFGAFTDGSQKWTDHQVEVIRPNKRLRDPTLTAVGLGATVEGVRCDLIIMDDVIDVETASSEAESEAAMRWFHYTILPRLDPGGKVVIIGTPQSPTDLYASLREAGGYAVHVDRAVLDGGGVLWASQWPLPMLEAKKVEIGSRAFAMRYQCEPQPLEGQVFKFGWFQWVSPTDVPPGLTWMGVDPALGKAAVGGEGRQGDWFAAVAVRKGPDGTCYVLGCVAVRESMSAAYAAVRSLSEMVHADKVQVEDVAFQWEAVSKAAELRGLPLTALKPEGRDKVARIRGTLEAAVEAGRLKFVRGAPGVDDLVSEMLTLPDAAHDDRTDALEIAARGLLSGVEDVAVIEHTGALFGPGRWGRR